ncbi:MAG: sodium/solute symporter, partial [Candidatus Hydrogenedentales bacterium]
RTIFAILTLVSYSAVNLAVVLYSGGLLLNNLFGMNIWICVILLAVVTGAYTVYGGLSSVAWTDAFQCVLLLLGGLLIFVLGLYKVEGGWEAIVGTGDRAHLILPMDHPKLPWPAMVALALVTNTWYYCTNQYINQRCLGAKDEWHAKMGMVLCGFLGIVLAFAVSFPGLIAYALNPNLPDPNTAYPYLVTTLLPPALQGIVLAGLVAAIMSTISSLVNSAATVFTIDVYQRFLDRGVAERRLVVVGRWSGTAILLIGLVCAPIVAKWEHIFSYCQEVWVLMAGPTVAVFLLGILWRGATSKAATFTMALTFPLTLIPYLQKAYPESLDFIPNTYVLGGVVCILCFVVMAVVSLFTQEKTKEEALALHWTPAMLALPGPVAAKYSAWYQRVGFWWLVLGLIYGAIYVTFW